MKSSGGGFEDLTLGELMALNEEIVALVRAGVPLERALIGMGGDWRGRIGRVAEEAGRRMEREGCSLAEAMAPGPGPASELYRAMVEAGARSGRLAGALEGVTEVVRSQLELRRMMALALLYPAIVVLMAYGLFVLFVTTLAPRLGAGFRSLEGPAAAVSVLARLGETASIWGPLGLGVLVVAAIGWRRSGRAALLGGDRTRRRGLDWAGTRGVLRLARNASYARLLALLLDHRVPMPEALTLSGHALGDPDLRSASEAAAEALRRGEALSDAMAPASAPGFPALIRCLILSGSIQGTLPEALRAAARTYDDRARLRIDLMRTVVPALLLVGIGGLAVLLYGLTLFVPLSESLREIA